MLDDETQGEVRGRHKKDKKNCLSKKTGQLMLIEVIVIGFPNGNRWAYVFYFCELKCF